MQIASANMYVNLALVFWCEERKLQRFPNHRIEVQGIFLGGEVIGELQDFLFYRKILQNTHIHSHNFQDGQQYFLSFLR